MPDLYKKLREADGSLPTPCRRFFRFADGAGIERHTDYHPDWVRFLAETENETVNIADADPVPPPGLADWLKQFYMLSIGHKRFSKLKLLISS